MKNYFISFILMFTTFLAPTVNSKTIELYPFDDSEECFGIDEELFQKYQELIDSADLNKDLIVELAFNDKVNIVKNYEETSDIE